MTKTSEQKSGEQVQLVIRNLALIKKSGVSYSKAVAEAQRLVEELPDGWVAMVHSYGRTWYGIAAKGEGPYSVDNYQWEMNKFRRSGEYELVFWYKTADGETRSSSRSWFGATWSEVIKEAIAELTEEINERAEQKLKLTKGRN